MVLILIWAFFVCFVVVLVGWLVLIFFFFSEKLCTVSHKHLTKRQLLLQLQLPFVIVVAVLHFVLIEQN